MLGNNGMYLKIKSVVRTFISKFALGTGNITWSQSTSNVYDNVSLTNFSVKFTLILYASTPHVAGGIASGFIYSSPANFSWYISFSDSKISVAAMDINDTQIIGVSTSISLNTELDIEVVIDSGTASIYIDGALQRSTSYTGTIDYSRPSLDGASRIFTLGGRVLNTLCADMALDEVVITDLDTSTIVFDSSAVYTATDDITTDVGVLNDVTQEPRV